MSADVAACYFCLGEEADEVGKPLVRDCSCRGDSAGFAHLSCLVTYAEQKCKQADDRDIGAFAMPWEKCNNCKQPFQNRLAIDLASSFVSFAEANYGHPGSSKWDKMKVMTSIKSNITALKRLTDRSRDRTETTMLLNNLLSMVNQTKKDLNMSGWIHMSKASEKYVYYRLLCGNYEAFVHHELGSMLMSDTSEEGFKVMITHFKKASAICKLVGMKDLAQHMDTTILMLTSNNQQSASPTVTSSMLQCMKNTYEQSIKTHGMNSAFTIESGLNYARMLLPAFRHIYAERLVTKVATASRRIHGPGHKTTCEAEIFLNKCKERHVIVLPDDKPFQALRYENGGEICVVTGPITKPRQVEDERMYHIANNLVIPSKGCAVIFHGLVSASHLNGELGEVRDVKKSGPGIRLAVHFEKKDAKSALVKPENLRIAFELPDEVM
jgi:hypothetical protein